ncbi:proteasome activator complex subunit 4-like [Ylistrum balloti]|uniref:proteasome activator complex subunit 4-like n=1 Tax=Ylistrum balloti TaxID=509963 RepID=UPI002905DAE4|nr:proteasome activator complex subunit 4-like [Ylistrum balloti]
MDDRADVLGFSPQQEKIYNNFLPYADKIDEESIDAFVEIKSNLTKAVALRDVKTGANHWVGMLSRYIRLYGLKFAKEDHIALIKLMYELILIPDLELSLIQMFANQLISLLKKRKLLSREDLCLPWRPLYQLVEAVAYSPYEPHGLQLFPPNVENVLKNLIKHCRHYFPLEATKEMLEEWRPLMCPFDVTNIKAIHYFEYFLPTNLPPHQQEHGWKLWFTEFMDIWNSFQNNPKWESGLVNLFSRLANDNIGYIDWSPFTCQIFNRFLRSFNLPVGTRLQKVGRSNNTYDVFSSVQWIIAMLGGNSGVQDYLDKIFKTLQTFYHPSNLGKWNVKLSGLLMTFPRLFVKRIHRERYQKPSWENQVPDSHKLSEDDITRFVESMKPVVFVSMFSKYGSHDSAIALRHLSNMRPEIIIPTLLEKMYPAMENLIEPHRLIACMTCIVAVARPMLHNRKWYPEGRSHLLPLLNLSLPGIDPNDFKKCLITFQMISTFVTLVPIVDCSEAVFVKDDLTEEEKELCSATAQFEDFVLQFFDRVFTLIENSAQEHVHSDVTRLNLEQSMLEVGLASTAVSVLQQCSTPIFKSALDRIHRFVTGSVFESRVGGRFAGNLCRAVAKVNPELTLKKFLSHLCSDVKNLLENHEDLKNEEQLDDSFLWNLIMLPQLVRCDGAALLPYKVELLEIIQMTLHLKCIQGYELAGQLLRYLLRALTLIYPLDYKSCAGSLDKPFSEWLAINEWAMPGDIHNLQMKWHVPNDEEMQFASEILHAILEPELEAIKTVSADNQMNREELLRRLNAILECLLGAGCVLPMWEDAVVNIVDSCVSLRRQHCQSTGQHSCITLNGRNVRETVVDAVRPLLSHMLATCEDDTKSLFKLIQIYETVMFFNGTQKNDFDKRWKSFHSVKQALEDQMRTKKRHIRAILVDRVQLQQELRMLNGCRRLFTERHKTMLLDLLSLSVSRYSDVRKTAQGVLFLGFHNLHYSYRCTVPVIVQNLKDSNTPEHVFKGTLYTLLGSGKKNIAMKCNWAVLGEVWTAITQAQHSEKPSILKVIDEIINKVVKNMESVSIVVKTRPSAIEAAKALLDTGTRHASFPVLTDQDLEAARIREEKTSNKDKALYHKLVADLVDLIENGNLMWKFSQIGMELLCLLLRHDILTPACAVRLYTKGMIHDSLYVRKLSLSSISAVLKQQKRRHKSRIFDPFKVSGTTAPSDGDFRPGNRNDNLWICYDNEKLPLTKEQWDSCTFVEKTHWGYYNWPKEMKTYAPTSEQPKLERKLEELREEEVPLYENLINPEFVDKFVEFLALEEHKRKDKFRTKTMTLFKGLHRNFGDTFLELLKPHIERLINDTSHDTHDSSQRCAMEMLSGILRGSKHWSYEKVESLWKWTTPLLKKALNNMTVETLDDWGTFFTVISESRDPRKLHWYFELVMENPLSGEGGSFGDSSRLYGIQSALSQQEWRVSKLLHRLLDYLMPHLSHPYKNVRDRIGSILSSIFLYDYCMSPTSVTLSPKREDFMKVVLPQIDGLKHIVLDEAATESIKNGGGANHVLGKGEELMEVEESEEDEERKASVRLCKSVMKWVLNSLSLLMNFTSAPPEFFQLLPIMCTLESETRDEELKTDCTLALSYFAQSLVQPDMVPLALTTIREVTVLQSWHARVAILSYVQVMVFCNYFTFHTPEHINEIEDIVLGLICDDQLEVREMAAITLSGLLHCGFLQMNQHMLDHFEHLSRTKVKKRKKLKDNLPLEALVKRHAGVLGLGAFVQAYPYDVPNFMPQILMDLSNHVNDPQPIQMTVKKTLSDFRRTHHDNWHDHKQMFTDDQLVILTDLLVSPTYYA